jgi:hypothetical protein
MGIRKVRLLIIDNKQNFLDMLENLLPKKIDNLSITQANSKEKALHEIDVGYFDIAVIDKRLVQDTDPHDESGIELANEIARDHPWLKIVMLTSFAEFSDITKKLPKNDEYGNLILCGYLSKKEESPVEWCSKIKDVIKSDLKINFNLKIKLVGFPFTDVGRLLTGTVFENKRIKDSDTELIENLSVELTDLFARIYCDDDTISITPVYKQGHSGTNVVKVYHGQNLAEIVKFGEKEKIEAEYKNYKNHVSGKIPDRTDIDEGKFARTKNLGAIAYSLIGADIREIKDFSEYYQNNDPGTIIDFLDRFFKENCKVWYSNPHEETLDLKETYKKYLNFATPQIKEAVKIKLPDFSNRRIIQVNEFGITFENPIFSASHALLKPSKTKECRTHGDLNPKDILVDRNIGWLIDFYSTGWGHYLRDFIMLEAGIKFSLTQEFNLSSLIQLEKTLLARDNFGEEYEFPYHEGEESLEKLFKCIKHIRKLAYELDELRKPQCVGEYYAGLFFTTLKMLQFFKAEGFTKSQNKKRLEFIFISAGLIYKKLENLGLVVSTAPGGSDGGEIEEAPHKPGPKLKTKGFNFDVFISHSSKDKKTVLDIIQGFKRKGVTYWVDHEQIEYGDMITGKIEEGLKNSKYILVVLSKHLGKSNWSRIEYGPILNREYNKKSGKKVIPLKIDDCNEDDIPLLLYDKKRAHYSNKEEFNDLLDYLKT